MSIVDQDVRDAALSPLHSFCVSAPAGSGKTELLIQRYLALLARVDRPEQVLAITFTRKAAAEMRERVLQALQEAIDEVACTTAHQRKTRDFALQVIDTDSQRQWRLLRNSSQMNIKTIDGFCSVLTRQMPVLSDFGGQADVTDFAEQLYREAVRELFDLVDSNSGIGPDLKALMLHFDNDWSRLQDLLVAMLGRREQWGSYLGVHQQADDAEEYLLHMVLGLVEDALSSLSQKLAPYSSELLALLNYAAGNLGTATVAQFPNSAGTSLPAWRELRQLLLTADKAGKWRAQVNVRMGFPAGKGEAQDYKDRLKNTIAELSEIEGLLEELAAVTSLPEIEANSSSWVLVLHLSRILPMLSAQLLLVFQRHGTVDHTQVALSALQALGSSQHPTELALRLDYQLQHLLLDEFQDTAINQYDLVTRLTRGWGEHNHANPDNPRTIMIVGDGMQSIYGFRNANVGLFLRARQEGFNGVALEYLNLLSNFRSEQGVVDWVNSTFSQAFPARDNIGRGQVSYTNATAVKPAKLQQAVGLHSFRGDSAAQQEIEFICAEVQRGIADTECASIAILARTRGHLQGILERFKALQIDYSAQDIDSLAGSQLIVDLMSLCRALCNPADKVAWMAVLRAPWCGLTLSDLHALQSGGGDASPWDMLFDEQRLVKLSEDGRRRINVLAQALLRAQRNRDRLALRIWLEQLWFEIQGPGTLESSAQLHDAEQFFQLLEQAELEGEGLNLQWLELRLQRLYVKAESPHSKVQVMTLHKAKGLEFDWVIIPSLQKLTRRNTRPLLNWDEHTTASGSRGFLLAANDHSDAGEPSLYNYLEIQRAKKELEETTRLLYVGATRAVSQLTLTASLKYNEEKEAYGTPSSSSLLGRIWPIVRDQIIEHQPSVVTAPETVPARLGLRRIASTDLGLESLAVQGAISDTEKSAGKFPRRSANRVERAVGTVVHLVLEHLGGNGVLPQNLAGCYRQGWSKRQWQFELRRQGVSGAELGSALERVESSIVNVLEDERGRWLFASTHRDASTELAVTVQVENGNPGNLIIDRTFVDSSSGKRWIVDYKNSQPAAGEALADFLAREELAYLPQLTQYRNALRGLGQESIVCALYFTALGYMHPVDSLSD